MKRISLFTFFIFLGVAGCMAQARKFTLHSKLTLMWDLLILVPL